METRSHYDFLQGVLFSVLFLAWMVLSGIPGHARRLSDALVTRCRYSTRILYSGLGRRRGLASVVLGCLVYGATWAGVTPPLETSIETPVKGFTSGDQTVALFVTVPDAGNSRVASIKLTLSAMGVAKTVGTSEWVIDNFRLGEPRQVNANVKIDGYGEGWLNLQAETFSADGARLWGRADRVFILQTTDEILSGKSSNFELRGKKIEIDMARGLLDSSQYEAEIRKLLEGKELRFERVLKGLSLVNTPANDTIAAVVASTTVSGRATYTHRTGLGTFATAANARGIPSALVEFFDSNAGVETKLTTTPAIVRTDATGNYTATVPGSRTNSTAVSLVVKLRADSPAAIIGPVGVGANAALVHTSATTATVVSAATMTVNLPVGNTDPTLLGAFALHEGLLVSFNFVVSNTNANGGVLPVKIFAEFPGNSSTGSFFSTSGGDHLNIGLGHAHDWDVYTHEYGHYVQKLNGTSASPGGLHYINGNNTGLVQPPGDGGRTLTKDQGIKLAWGEGWPTFFGTNLQVSAGAGAFGIFTAGDLVYADTANNFSYDLEGNNSPWQGTGEDNELSVQRLLWDFADKLQDGHDDGQFGNDQMWTALNSGTKPVTLNQFRAKFDNLTPSSPAGYSTGSQILNRVKYGRVYFDHNIGPEPIAPGDGDSSATPPTFRWKTKGASSGSNPARGYKFNQFNVVFYNKDFSTVAFTSPEIPTAKGSISADGLTAEWTPTAAEWTTITSADTVLHWAVAGSHADATTPTGPYLGLDRSIGGPSIVFVIDDTGSMSAEIGGVRDGLTSFITTLQSMVPPVQTLIEVITFKDNVTHRIASRNLAEVQAVVNSLSASGGGDCPESSAEALREAIANIGRLGVIIFATDASPHAGYDLSGIKAQALAKGIILNQIVTGDCAPTGGVSSLRASQASSRAWSTGAKDTISVGSDNPGYIAPVGSDEPVQWLHDAICPGCPAGTYTGPAMTPNILKPIGASGLPTPSAVASYADLTTASPKGTFRYLPGAKTGDKQPFVNAVANAALSAVLPTVLATQPAEGYQGAVMDVTVNGGSTNFRANSILSFDGSGITVNSITVLSSTQLVANITINAAATAGFRKVTVTTDLGGGTIESAGGSGQFRVNAGTASVALTSAIPAMVAQGSTVALKISGLNTHFGAGTIVSFGGTGIDVVSVSALSSTKLQANLSIAADATLGFRQIRVTTGTEVVTLDSTLIVVASVGATPGVPTILSVSPSNLLRGTNNLVLTVLGTNTNFVNGTTTATVSGSGVTVVSTTVTAPTAAQVTVNISSDAPLGSRDINLITGGETAALVGSLSVIAAPVPVCTVSASPSTVAAGGASTLTTSCSPAATSYSWTGGTCVGTTVASCIVTPATTTTYTVAGINTSGAGIAASVTVTVTAIASSTRLINLSTRGQVLTGDNVMIGGFIISGSTPKKVLIRAVGPTLSNYGVSGVLADPTLRLISGSTVIASNDDWGTAANVAAIQATSLAPSNPKESAILTTLNPGAYTAIVSGFNSVTGVGIVEVFELDNPDAPLINLSTRGQVQTGDNVMIGGFVIDGSTPQKVLIRAVGPTLANYGVSGVLADPMLQLNSGSTVIASNDDWGDAANAAAIAATGLAPGNGLESAILITLTPGAYTVIVSGFGSVTGVGIIEVFAQ